MVTTDAATLVRQARAILLDFDGPVTFLMPSPANAQAAEAARTAIPASAGALPNDLATTTDHLALLRWAGTRGSEALAAVEKACIEAEVDAARASKPTIGALDFLHWCNESGKDVVIVSNNAAEAIHAFLNRFQANRLVRGVVGRAEHHPELMKPHPSLVLAALDLASINPPQAVLIGDSISDIEGAHGCAVPVIGFGKTPARAIELTLAGADSLVISMTELLE